MGASGIIICVIIGLAFIVGLIQIISVNGELKSIKADAEKARHSTEGEASISRSNNNITKEHLENFNVQRMDSTVKRYNEQSVKLTQWSQYISIFPLLGLLGTVLGLIPGLKTISEGDFTSLFNSLSTALWTTVGGIVAAIILKWLLTHFALKEAEEIENLIEENDRIYTNLLNFHKLSE